MLAPFEVPNNVTIMKGVEVDKKIVMFKESSTEFLIEMYKELSDEGWRNKFGVKEYAISNVLEGIQKELQCRKIKVSSFKKHKCSCGEKWYKQSSNGFGIRQCLNCGKNYCVFCGHNHECQNRRER